MYRNILNNGDLSDYNSLKKQRDNGAIVKNYSSKKLKTQPTELQKYYQYLTYQQPILDEINYSAEKMKDENLKKQKEDWEYTEKLKEQREKSMKDMVGKTETKTAQDQIRKDLFDDEPKPPADFDPTFQTDNDLELEIRDKEQVFEEAVILDLDAGKPPKNKGLLLEDTKNALSYDLFDSPILFLEDKKDTYAEEAKKKYQEYLKKYNGVSSTISDVMNRPIIKSLPPPTKSKVNTDFFINITQDLPIKSDLQTGSKKSGGRPKGSQTNYNNLEFNREAKRLDLTGDEPIIIDKKAERETKKSKIDAEKQVAKQIKIEAQKAKIEEKKQARETKKANRKKK